MKNSINYEAIIKKYWWAFLLFIVITILIVMLIISLTGNKPTNNLNVDNSKSQEKSAFLPSNTCPDKRTIVNGISKIEYQGKEVMVTSEQMTWIDQNCKNLNDQSPSLAQSLDCKPRTHEYYRTQKAFAIDPSDSNIMYLAVEYKGVYKTVDGGKTWNKIVNGITAYNITGTSEKCYQEFGRILIDPTNPQRILLSRVETPGTIKDMFSENAGLWESTNGGNSWKQLINGNMNASGSKAILIDPQNPNIVYYGANNSPASYSGADKNKFYNNIGDLYKSTDGGKTWAELNTGLQKNLRAMDLKMDPQNSNKLYLGNFHSGLGESPDLDPDQSLSLLVSEDAGKTWTSLSSKLPNGYQAVYEIAISSNNNKNIYVVSQPTKSSNAGKSFYSLDGGSTFMESNKYIYTSEYDPFDTKGSTLLGYNPFVGENDIFKSTDGGKTWILWSKSGLSSSEDRVTNITFDKKNKNTVYMNGNLGTIIRSQDGGKTWSKVTDSTMLP